MLNRALALLVSILALFALAVPAHAEVRVSFHSFNGSLFGRYPHTFVVFEGTLDATGEAVNENYGFSAKTAGPNVLMGRTAQIVMSEPARYVRTTNRHFTLPVSDATYRRMKAEIYDWAEAPESYYDLDSRNCIHFVGRMAELAGLKVDYPGSMLRKPKEWLNRVTQLNPQLGARLIR